MVVEEHFGIADGIFGADKDERNATFFAWHGRFRLIVTFDFDSDHT